MNKEKQITFVPTLDISNGKAVLVRNGKVYKVFGDALEKAKFLSIHKHFQLIDVDRALGNGNNTELIKKIVQKYPCYVGGGIRTFEDAVEFLNSSAKRIIIATNLTKEFVRSIPKERLIIAFDIDQNYHVLIKGRTDVSQYKFEDVLKEFGDYVEIISVTFHHTEGLCNGIPFDQVEVIKNMVEQYNIKLSIGGGIANIIEITKLMEMNITPQFGSGFWNGLFTLGDVYLVLLNNVKQSKWIVTKTGENTLYPCIVQNIDGIILGLTYCNKESLKISVDTRIATFYSRDQDTLWIKGATSGNYHIVHQVHLNCDNTAIRMIVEGKQFCHFDCISCFGHCDPSRGSLKSLQRIIQQSKEGSYTSQLLKSETRIKSKILEEANELVCSIDEEIVHESADLFFFISMFLEKNKVDIRDVEQELIKRHYVVLKDKPFKPIIDTKLKIGIVSNNGIDAINYIETLLSIKITCPTNRSYEYKCDNEDIKIIPVKPKDIPILINNEFIDGIISYEDIIMNYDVDVEKILTPKHKEKKVSIVISVKDGITLEMLREINKERKLVIMAEYVKLTSDWIRKQNLRAKIVHVHGTSESYLVNGLCDASVMVCDTGKTLKENNLIILDTLVTTMMHLFIARTSLHKLSKFV
jgi:ATP phosphoribosyltransferase